MLNLNTNLIHNIINFMIILLPASLLATGCIQLVDGDLDCSQSFLNPTYVVWATGALGVLKVAMNWLRDGIGGLYKVQPPVRENATIASIGTPPTPTKRK